jgi:hypothetical protein
MTLKCTGYWTCVISPQGSANSTHVMAKLIAGIYFNIYHISWSTSVGNGFYTMDVFLSTVLQFVYDIQPNEYQEKIYECRIHVARRCTLTSTLLLPDLLFWDPMASNLEVFCMQHNMLETSIQTYSTNIKFHIQFFTTIVFSIYAAPKNHYHNLGYPHSEWNEFEIMLTCHISVVCQLLI